MANHFPWNYIHDNNNHCLSRHQTKQYKKQNNSIQGKYEVYTIKYIPVLKLQDLSKLARTLKFTVTKTSNTEFPMHNILEDQEIFFFFLKGGGSKWATIDHF